MRGRTKVQKIEDFLRWGAQEGWTAEHFWVQT